MISERQSSENYETEQQLVTFVLLCLSPQESTFLEPWCLGSLAQTLWEQSSGPPFHTLKDRSAHAKPVFVSSNSATSRSKTVLFPLFPLANMRCSAFPHRAQERCRWLLLAREADSEAMAFGRQCSPGGSQGRGSAPHAWEGGLVPCRGPTRATPGTAYLLWASVCRL